MTMSGLVKRNDDREGVGREKQGILSETPLVVSSPRPKERLHVEDQRSRLEIVFERRQA